LASWSRAYLCALAAKYGAENIFLYCQLFIFHFFFVFLQQQPAASCIFFSGLFTAQVAKANWVAIEGVARPECNAFCILNNVYGRKIFVDYCLTWSGSSSKAVAVAIGPQFSPINPSA